MSEFEGNEYTEWGYAQEQRATLLMRDLIERDERLHLELSFAIAMRMVPWRLATQDLTQDHQLPAWDIETVTQTETRLPERDYLTDRQLIKNALFNPTNTKPTSKRFNKRFERK
uniref:Uncharacterized protein n=1 Tax=Clandestinovirus TaxID=2831644 RepID=A0A8F8KLX5_9VIRU|nr:hypothetical protein KOM_12_556 [Clandestinovirus]